MSSIDTNRFYARYRVSNHTKTPVDRFLENKSWGIAGEISTGFRPQSTYLNARYFFGGYYQKRIWNMTELAIGSNFNGSLRIAASDRVYLGHSVFALGANAEFYTARGENCFYLAPLFALEGEFIALEYNYKIPLTANRFVPPHTLSLIIRPRRLWDAYQGENWSQYWERKS